MIIPLSTVGEQMLGKAWFCDWREVAPFAFFKCSARPNESFWKFVYFLPSVGDHVAPQVFCLTKWLSTFWASVVLHSTLGEHVRFQRASHTKWLVALVTIVCSFFAVSDYWLCASTDLLLDWMIEHLCILPPLLASVCLSILISFCSDQEPSTPWRLTN